MNLERFYAKLDRFYSEGDAQVVEKHLKYSLEDAKIDKDYGAILVISNELGGYLRAVGKHEEAVPVYHDAIDALRKLSMFGTENHATTLINEATNYAVWGKSEQALEIFETARLLLEQLGIETDFRMATLHNNMSIVCQDLENYEAAIEHLNKALAILYKLEDTQIEVATTYTNIAQIMLLKEDYEGALAEIKQALHMFEVANALKDTHYMGALETYGQICYKLEQYDTALSTFQKARDLIYELFGDDHAGYHALVETIENIKTKHMESQYI